MNVNWNISGAEPTDAQRLAPLLTDLGYPSSAKQVFTRLTRIAGDPTYRIWLARLPDGVAVGMGAGHLVFPIEHDAPAAQLTALVSAESVRGQGVGAALVEHFERWALSQGAQRVIVTSSAARTRAHRFYEHLGYTETGKRFGRPLRRPAR